MIDTRLDDILHNRGENYLLPFYWQRGSATDKMLDAVLEGAGVLEEESSGAIAAHEAKLSTRIERADQLAAEAESEAYLDEIMKKYSGGK